MEPSLACFMHPVISLVGLTEETASAGGFSKQIIVVETSFKATSKFPTPPNQQHTLQEYFRSTHEMHALGEPL